MKKVLDLIEKVVNLLVKLISVVLVFLSVMQVFTRYVINYSFSFTTEVSIYLFIWLVMLGAGVIMREKGHPAVLLFYNAVPEKGKKSLFILQTLVSALFLGVLFYQGLMMTFKMMGHKSAAAQIPMSLVYLSIPVGSFIMLLYLFENVFKKEETEVEIH